MKTLSEILQELWENKDDKFKNGEYKENMEWEEVNNSLSASICELLEQVVPEESQREDDFSIGFNACRSEVKNRIKIVLK